MKETAIFNSQLKGRFTKLLESWPGALLHPYSIHNLYADCTILLARNGGIIFLFLSLESGRRDKAICIFVGQKLHRTYLRRPMINLCCDVHHKKTSSTSWNPRHDVLM
ncbi:hypothetical protein Trydic_g9621 [Trypoxylus dichotomus]